MGKLGIIVGLACSAAFAQTEAPPRFSAAVVEASDLIAHNIRDVAARPAPERSLWSLRRVNEGMGIDEDLQIFYNGSQYAALHPYSSYFRMVYGPDSGWGTSTVLLPIYWDDDKAHPLHQGANAPGVAVEFNDAGPDLVVKIKGVVGKLRAEGAVTIHPPGTGCGGNRKKDCIVADVAMKVEPNPAIVLTKGPEEAFKPVFLSSMHVDKANWDSYAVSSDVGDTLNGSMDAVKGGPICTVAHPAKRLVLHGGHSAWNPNAPTVELNMIEVPRNVELSAAGWKTASNNPEDDNIGVWFGVGAILDHWRYTIEVHKE